MIEIREVIRRWQARQSLREIARETRLDRKTVRGHVATLEEQGIARDAVLDDALVHEVGNHVQAWENADGNKPGRKWLN